MASKAALFEYLLHLGDSSLVLGHRLSEWCGHGPILEEDIAMTNMALDLIGRARALLSYAGEIEGRGRTDDDLAYQRDAYDFRNALLAEQPNGDFAHTMMRQFLYDAYGFFLHEELKKSKDEKLAGIAEKSLKETTYHLRHMKEWILRLGDGTDESHQRAQNALDDLWMYTGDLFDMNDTDKFLIKEGIAPDLNTIKSKWENLVNEILTKATLKIPDERTWMIHGSREGKHTEHLGYLLAEMQFLPRAYPGTKW